MIDIHPSSLDEIIDRLRSLPGMRAAEKLLPVVPRLLAAVAGTKARLRVANELPGTPPPRPTAPQPQPNRYPAAAPAPQPEPARYSKKHVQDAIRYCQLAREDGKVLEFKEALAETEPRTAPERYAARLSQVAITKANAAEASKFCQKCGRPELYAAVLDNVSKGLPANRGLPV